MLLLLLLLQDVQYLSFELHSSQYVLTTLSFHSVAIWFQPFEGGVIKNDLKGNMFSHTNMQTHTHVYMCKLC